MDNLLINIAAETKEFMSGLSEVGEQTGNLDDKLKKVGLAAGVAFAGFTASIMESVYAFHEQEKVGLEIGAILKSTGGIAGVTADAINEMADAFSKSTTFSELQVKRGEEILLTFNRIGKDTFPAATKATLDLAQRMGGDTAGAAQVLGRALQDPEAGMSRLARAGIIFTAQQKEQIKVLEDSGNMAGAQAIILKQVESQYGGMAEAAAGGTGSILRLKNSMEALVEHIGAQFAPYINIAANGLNNLLTWAKDNEGFVKVVALTLAAGAAFTGLVTAAIAAKFAMGQMTASFEVANVVIQAMGLSVRGLVGATGIGLLLIVAYEIYEHWNVLWPAMKEVFHAFVNTTIKAAAGLAKVLEGALTFNYSKIKAGWDEVVTAFKEGASKAGTAVGSIFKATSEQRAIAKESGDQLGKAEALARAQALQREEDRGRQRRRTAEMAAHQAELMSLGVHTQKVIALKKEEASTLAKIADESFAYERGALTKHLAEVRKEYAKEVVQEREQLRRYHELVGHANTSFNKEEQRKLVSSIQTKQQAIHQNELEDLNFKIQSDNTFLQEADRFGVAYAAINQAMHSKIIQGTESAFKEMSQLQQSNNSSLKAIGKAAAVSQIAIDTVTSAMNIFKGWSNIPYIGYALGIAGAAAATAYGLERESQVLGMAQGGQVPWNLGTPGVDSVPLLAKPGEVFAPPETFKEMVNSGKLGGGSGQKVEVVVSFRDKNAARMLQVQIVQDKALGVFRG